jgi:hypothetical protein
MLYDRRFGGMACLHLQGDHPDCVDAEVVGKKGVCRLYGQISHITNALHSSLPNPFVIHAIQIVTLKKDAVCSFETSIYHMEYKPKRTKPTDQQPP